MLRHFCTLALALLLSSPALAQSWATKMFNETSHDFGTVVRGAKVEHRFRFKNIYLEDVHIAGIRTSCGCTTPSVTKTTLKTWETSEVLAHFNTNTFLGYRSATLTLTIDKPYYAEVQLQVTGNIRGDIVVNPGSIDLGSVDAGTPVERRISVTHSGRTDWKILDVRSANSDFEVEVMQTRRSGGDVSYDLLVRLKGVAPPGYIKEQLLLVTNDPRRRQFPIDVEGRVVASLTVSPPSLSLGTLTPGQTVTKNLVVRGRSPFRIMQIECPNKSFRFKMPESARQIQLVPVTFTAQATPGKVSEKIRIKTDSEGGGTAELMVHANIKLPARPDQSAELR